MTTGFRIARGGLVLALLLVAAACAMPLDQINGDRATSALVLQIEPADARVFLDGAYIGRASCFDGRSGVLRLTPGGHVLRFEAGEYENELREVTAREGGQTLAVKMLPRPKPAGSEG